jgi:hypothetical protein
VLNKSPKTQTSVAKDSLMLTVDILLFSRVLLELNGLTLTINAATATLSGVLLTFGKIRPLKSLDSHGLETISLKVSVVPLNDLISPLRNSVPQSSVSGANSEHVLAKLQLPLF